MGGCVAFNVKECLQTIADILLGLVELRSVSRNLAHINLVGQIVLHGVGQDEVAVGQALHQGGGTKTVGTVVGEVGFAGSKEARNGGLQFVVHPKTAHGIVDGGIDHHGVLVGVHIDNLLVHLEEVAIFLLHHIASQTLDSIGKVEVHGQTRRAYTVASIATLFGSTRCHIAGHQVAESGIAAFQIVVAILFGDVIGTLLAATDGLSILLLLGHPDAAIVAEALTHQRQLGLVVAVDGDAGGVNLDIAGVGKSCAFLVAHPGGGAVAVHGIGGEVVDIAIATCGQHDGMGGIALEITSDKVAGDDAACAAVDNDEFHHLVAFMQFDTAAGNLTAQRTVGTEEELLAGLAAGVEGAADLRAAEGAVVEQSAIVAGKGNALRHTLVDDGTADLGQTVDVGLAGMMAPLTSARR